MRLKRNCEEASALLIAREDQNLPLFERVALQIHLWHCPACVRFKRQILTMRQAMQAWRQSVPSSEIDHKPNATQGKP